MCVSCRPSGLQTILDEGARKFLSELIEAADQSQPEQDTAAPESPEVSSHLEALALDTIEHITVDTVKTEWRGDFVKMVVTGYRPA